MVTVWVQYRSESKFLTLDAKNHLHPGSNYQNYECVTREKGNDGAVNLQIRYPTWECIVLTSVNEPEVTEKSRCVTGPPIGVKFEDEPGSRAVEHVRNVCKPTTQKSWPGGILVHFWPVQMEKKFQEVTALTTETENSQHNFHGVLWRWRQQDPPKHRWIITIDMFLCPTHSPVTLWKQQVTQNTINPYQYTIFLNSGYWTVRGSVHGRWRGFIWRVGQYNSCKLTK